MYKEIELIIFSENLSKSEIAEKLGITYNTFLLKLKGKYSFSLDEAIKLKEILNTNKTIEELFAFSTAAWQVHIQKGAGKNG